MSSKTHGQKELFLQEVVLLERLDLLGVVSAGAGS